MKTFRFGLDPALRWRGWQVDAAQNRAAATATELKAMRAAIAGLRDTLAGTAAEVARGSFGEALQSLEGWAARCNREIRELEQRAQSTEELLATHLRDLVTANKNARVIEKLRQSAHASWRSEEVRELETFAGEMFLRQVTIRERTGA